MKAFFLLHKLSICVLTKVHPSPQPAQGVGRQRVGRMARSVGVYLDSQQPVATEVPTNSSYDASLIPRQIFKDK